MELQLQNRAQHMIADLLWTAESQDEVTGILARFGHDARVVYEMMCAATFDQVEDTDIAERELARFRSAGLL